jgi:hypothetical protein
VETMWRPCGDRDLREAVKAENQAAVSKSVSNVNGNGTLTPLTAAEF